MSFITINGRLAFAPKKVVRKTANGDVQVTELRVITNPFVGGVKYTNSFNITVWPGRYEKFVEKLGVGSAVIAIGMLYIVEYTDKNKQNRTSNNVNLMHLSFPVSDSDEISKKRKKAEKKPGVYLDDNAVLSTESEGQSEAPDTEMSEPQVEGETE